MLPRPEGGQSSAPLDFDLIICDEAHRTTGVTLAGEDESHFVRIHDNSYIWGSKRLYMTATPRLFKEKVKKAATEQDAVLASMDDESIYGPVFHRLGFGEAVGLGLLTDYKVVVLAVAEDQVTPIYQDQADLGSTLMLTDTAKLVGCWNALAKRRGALHHSDYGENLTPMRRAVAFCKDIRTSKLIAERFPAIVDSGLRDLTNADPSDDLRVECQHVDGGMNAVARGERLDWLKEDTSGEASPVCRVLTNARCLSEGVDVPTLDAVLFLNPRKSQVDVIQAVGRVMRKAPGKEFGYIILPVAIPAGVAPEVALGDNKRYQVIWQVLQALRAHDDRMEATINAIDYNVKSPENIVVDVVDLRPSQPTGNNEGDLLGGAAGDPATGDPGVGGSGEPGAPGGSSTICAPADPTMRAIQMAFDFTPEEWKDAVYAKIVKKVGSTLYWDDWSKDIAQIAGRYQALIDRQLENPLHQDAFLRFVKSLQHTLNPSIGKDQAKEMLAQHLITKPLFDAMFDDQDFTAKNPVSRAMQAIVDHLEGNQAFDNERRPLDAFYSAMVKRIREVDNLAGKQRVMLTLYDRFFSQAFPKMSERLGIVFTPVPVVDYIIHSANAALEVAFGKTLGDPGIAVIEPFVGTGTFIARLLQSGIITPEQLEYKYRHEIFANEIVLLSYYIASINIESVYRQIRLEQGFDDGYVEFEGISLTDTFQLHESDGWISNGNEGFDTNSERAKRQKSTPIQVVIMNPPYSAGQKTANDDNQNLKYPRLDARIEETYAARSTATNKNSLYDSYFRALRWASDRIGDEGVIAFVSNNSFIDSNSADGVRLTWGQEFSDIFIYNLKGNARTQGERRRQEGDGVFGEGSRTGTAITVLVKTRDHVGAARIHYAEVADYLSRQEKLDEITEKGSIASTDFEEITPNNHGDWIDQRDDTYLAFQPIGDKTTKGEDATPGIFKQHSNGLQTNRDAWCYNFSAQVVADNMSRMIANYNAQVDLPGSDDQGLNDPRRISWCSQLRRDYERGKIHHYSATRIRAAQYRPFCRHSAYFDRTMNHRIYQLPALFPTAKTPNLAFGLTGTPNKPWSLLAVDTLPDLHLLSATNFFSLYCWVPMTKEEPTLFGAPNESTSSATFSGRFDFSRPIGDQVPLVVDGYRRRDNITDATLAAYREHYADDSITKEDIFFYVYALLHHPEYRQRYAADLKKMLPRIPKCAGFSDYALIGRELADLHVNYERVTPYPLKEEWSLTAPEDPWQRYHVVKPAWAKRSECTALKYNEFLTLRGIPEEAQDYQVGGRSPLDWVVDRYRIKTDKDSQIPNDPNDYCREVNRADYIVDLIKRLVTVSLETQRLVASLPSFNITE